VTQPGPSQQDASSPLSDSSRRRRTPKNLPCGSRFEKAARAAGARVIAGVDEVGRGALFGSVVAAACILDPRRRIRGLRDSKCIPEPERETLAPEIRSRALAWAVAEIDAAQIDRINIGRASLLAMKLAVERLSLRPDYVLVDGHMRIEFEGQQQTIINGDALSVSIAAASILAKVHRDGIVRSLASAYPHYDLASNKGYGTAAHLQALQLHGPSPLHRRSFSPVAALLSGGVAADCAAGQSSFEFDGFREDDPDFTAEEMLC
jgi:ribonuclease HII